ncbi:DeoR/GlpR family DNA-binding transcription regulator [Roseibium sp. MMSF_3412]|uniref:DeoR/GlpR family DNA-binding transcription regulator n=1 Tax=Roseibium sp. MMSF_3412 TaxID=3046712 RepID=UPI00274015EF|nr:DeoR/GlpR family DNA-binding transcription regulator [Roseibium sp. MMSF_3412]
MSNISHLPNQRRAAILETLARGEAVSAAKLAADYAVSEDAIRRDLRKLAAEGLCEKVYGGALPVAPSAQPVSVRTTEDVERKEALVKAALTLIKPRDCLFLDVGSTNIFLAEHLPRNFELTVVTNSVPVIAKLMGRKGLALFSLGGAVNADVGGTTGSQAIKALEQFQFDLTFLGTCGLCRQTGVSAYDAGDAEVKRAAVQNSRRVAILATAKKLGTRLPHKVLSFERIDCLVLEADAGEEHRTEFETDVNQVVVAGPAAASRTVVR